MASLLTSWGYRVSGAMKRWIFYVSLNYIFGVCSRPEVSRPGETQSFTLDCTYHLLIKRLPRARRTHGESRWADGDETAGRGDRRPITHGFH